jgi:hypothetical protein
MTKSPPPLEPWESENLSAHFQLLNELGRAGKLKSSKTYSRSETDWRKPIDGEVKIDG